MPLQALAAWLSRIGDWLGPDAGPVVHGCSELRSAELERIRCTAELAADWLCCGMAAAISNPWPRGTRQWVLWETSFQAQLLQHEFAPTSPEGLAGMEEADMEPEPVACLAA